MLAEATSEILNLKCKVDSPNICIRDFQRQAHSHRLELCCANCAYEEFEESRRLHEEFGLPEKNFEMEELKRNQEMWIDDFSSDKRKTCYQTESRFTKIRVAGKNEFFD